MGRKSYVLEDYINSFNRCADNTAILDKMAEISTFILHEIKIPIYSMLPGLSGQVPGYIGTIPLSGDMRNCFPGLSATDDGNEQFDLPWNNLDLPILALQNHREDRDRFINWCGVLDELNATVCPPAPGPRRCVVYPFVG
jgi:hypothetical protein